MISDAKIRLFLSEKIENRRILPLTTSSVLDLANSP
jgi:hypothetical protein